MFVSLAIKFRICIWSYGLETHTHMIS